jgi:hypothetical protein
MSKPTFQVAITAAGRIQHAVLVGWSDGTNEGTITYGAYPPNDVRWIAERVKDTLDRHVAIGGHLDQEVVLRHTDKADGALRTLQGYRPEFA